MKFVAEIFELAAVLLNKITYRAVVSIDNFTATGALFDAGQGFGHRRRSVDGFLNCVAEFGRIGCGQTDEGTFATGLLFADLDANSRMRIKHVAG